MSTTTGGTEAQMKIESLLNYLVSRELITQAQYARTLTYVSRATGGGV